jgi:hypothetical protein
MKTMLFKILDYYISKDARPICLVILIGTILFLGFSSLPITHHFLKSSLLFNAYSAFFVYLIAKPLRRFVLDSKIYKNTHDLCLSETKYLEQKPHFFIRLISTLSITTINIGFIIGCIVGYVYMSSFVLNSGRYLAMKYYNLPHYIAYPCSYYDYGNYEENSDFRNLTEEQIKQLLEYYKSSSNPYSRYSNDIWYYCDPPERDYDY